MPVLLSVLVLTISVLVLSRPGPGCSGPGLSPGPECAGPGHGFGPGLLVLGSLGPDCTGPGSDDLGTGSKRS